MNLTILDIAYQFFSLGLWVWALPYCAVFARTAGVAGDLVVVE